MKCARIKDSNVQGFLSVVVGSDWSSLRVVDEDGKGLNGTIASSAIGHVSIVLPCLEG